MPRVAGGDVIVDPVKDKGLVAVDPKGELRRLDQPAAWPAGLQARPAAETTDWILANAGARPWDRDAVGRRQSEEVRAGRGKIIDFESEVGGWAAK